MQKSIIVCTGAHFDGKVENGIFCPMMPSSKINEILMYHIFDHLKPSKVWWDVRKICSSLAFLNLYQANPHLKGVDSKSGLFCVKYDGF